ncbi:hypothetical protein CRP01_08885 [Flavilitoribacter nigricans DSM 23189 = NBRC 102662]|uniref:META domain-containing protein n=2 Tax=Flavilitoribacter TaxID=2762562 RepID=A0A2D0NEI7_FLAN2|nr:hypothetical protein CRP01_08885 [Flavilitoribacter nigricans DSM 23189 = NBRC 102662]
MLFSACSKDQDEISYDLTGDWKVVYYIDHGEKITKTEDNTWPHINNGDITANFSSVDSNGEGDIAGVKVSNAYGGKYTIQNHGNISFGPMATTFVAEPEWTRLYQIMAAQRYEIRNSILLIFYNDGKNIIAFERI